MTTHRLDQDFLGLRRRVYIDPALQGTILARILTYWASMTLLTTIALCGGAILRNPWSHAPQICLSICYEHRILYLAMLFVLRLQIGDALRMSHRVAGPMYRVRRHLSQVLEGRDVDQLRFRRDDFWHDVAGKINALVARLDTESAPCPEMHAREAFAQTLTESQA
jgi:hypothetical protein